MVKKGVLNVLKNKLVPSFSNNRGSTNAIFSSHLWVYSQIVSLFPISIIKRLDMHGSMSMLNLYCFINAPTKSFHPQISVLLSLMYHFNAASLRLYWKKWISSFSSWTI